MPDELVFKHEFPCSIIPQILDAFDDDNDLINILLGDWESASAFLDWIAGPVNDCFSKHKKDDLGKEIREEYTELLNKIHIKVRKGQTAWIKPLEYWKEDRYHRKQINPEEETFYVLEVRPAYDQAIFQINKGKVPQDVLQKIDNIKIRNAVEDLLITNGII